MQVAVIIGIGSMAQATLSHAALQITQASRSISGSVYLGYGSWSLGEDQFGTSTADLGPYSPANGVTISRYVVRDSKGGAVLTARAYAQHVSDLGGSQVTGDLRTSGGTAGSWNFGPNTNYTARSDLSATFVLTQPLDIAIFSHLSVFQRGFIETQSAHVALERIVEGQWVSVWSRGITSPEGYSYQMTLPALTEVLSLAVGEYRLTAFAETSKTGWNGAGDFGTQALCQFTMISVPAPAALPWFGVVAVASRRRRTCH
ncbi:MAG TPA: hypothetical protein VK157_01960 [Phycisphaerales bacterium]|nr:hypothetical protein [Phycisphaerales bacterium]